MKTLYFDFNPLLEIAIDERYLNASNREPLNEAPEPYVNIHALDLLFDDNTLAYMCLLADIESLQYLLESLIQNPYPEHYNVPALSLEDVTLTDVVANIIENWKTIDRKCNGS